MEPISILNQALSEPVGYAIVTDDLPKLRTKLYAARREEQRNGNHDFDEISFFELSDNQTLFIVRHDALRQFRGDDIEQA